MTDLGSVSARDAWRCLLYIVLAVLALCALSALAGYLLHAWLAEPAVFLGGGGQ